MGLHETEYRKVLSVIDELGSSPDPETFMDRTVRLVHELVPCDQASFSESDPDRRVELAATAWPAPEWTEEMEVVYWTYSHQNPLCDALAHDGAAHLRRMSDVIDRRGLHRLDFYQESLRPNGVEYDLMMQLPWGVGRCRAVELSRADRDFSERDLEVLSALQPHLIREYRDAQDRRRLRQLTKELEASSVTLPPEPDPALGLTPREVEVLLLISQGLTNRQAARRLSITPNTVRKHLENAYEKLGVGTRTAAIAKAFGGWAARSA